MKHTEESVSRSTNKTLMRPAKEERKSYRLRAFRGSAHRGLFLYRNELICQAKLAILTAFEEDPDKPFVATKNSLKNSGNKLHPVVLAFFQILHVLQYQVPSTTAETFFSLHDQVRDELEEGLGDQQIFRYRAVQN